MVSKIHKAFTLIELIVVITVILVLVSSAIVSFNTYNDRQRVRQAIQTLKSDLRYAQSKAISGQKPALDCEIFEGYEIKFPDETSYTIQPICSGLVAYPGPVNTVSLPGGVTTSPVPNPIQFNSLSRGVITTSHTITFIGRSSFTNSLTITDSGVITD